MAPGGPLTDRLCLLCGLCCSGVLFKDVELQPGDNAEKLAGLGLPLKRSGRHEGVSTPPNGLSNTPPSGPVPRGQDRRTTRPACSAKFAQPCAALQTDGRCRIYADRPSRCREFDCALLKSVGAGQCALKAALRILGTARARVDRVRRLLRELGDWDEQLALRLRFKRLHRRLARARLDDETAATFSRLTLAVHGLNLLLREAFYP